MKVCVLGLWHLGTVTAACLADAGHQVVGLDFDEPVVGQLRQGRPPLFEPGLEELLKQGLANRRLSFTTEPAEAVRGADVVWVTYDTPVDDADHADVEYVVERIARLFPHLAAGVLVMVSSQLPVGTMKRLEHSYANAHPGKPVTFGCSPENLQLGKAIGAFTKPDRVIAGIRSDQGRKRFAELLGPLGDRIEWMSVESAEMTKHALNAFLATSVTFANEVAVLCEQVGADAKEVERGLKSERRIGPKAYLSPGPAFAGGTLARDIAFLIQAGEQHRVPTHLLSAVRTSNDRHKLWMRHKLEELLSEKGGGGAGRQGQTVAVWGLTYKPGTDTLRRSSSIELCRWLAERGMQVRAHDPAVKILPPELADRLTLCATPLEALEEAAVLVVATEWPDYLSVSPDHVVAGMRVPAVIDPGRFLADTLGRDARIRYAAVGRGRATEREVE